LTLTIKKEEERIVSKGGNASLLYLPKEYFTPGEKINSQLEIDPDGNLKMLLTKCLFNFTCDTIKELFEENNTTVEYDKTIADTRILSATQDNITLNCAKSMRDLEPTYVTVTKRYEQVKSPQEYGKIVEFMAGLLKCNLDAYLEPEGDLETLNIYKNPQKYKLKDQNEAIDALNATDRKIGFSLIIRFNSKSNTAEQIKSAIEQLKS
jgi:hypothetical protein